MTAGGLHVLQATAWYGPYSIGGTETYVAELAASLHEQGITNTILVPKAPEAPDRYMHAGQAVETYPVNEIASRDEIRTGSAHAGFDLFRAKLEAHQGAIYHQHSWSRGCGLLHLRAAHELGFRTVLTVHVASAICLRGTMVRFGSTQCDGQVLDGKCGACWAQGKGVPRVAASCVAALPLPVSRRLGGGRSRLATLFSARAIAAARATQLRDVAVYADRVVAVCAWLERALLANGVPAAKLHLNRQGLSAGFIAAARTATAARGEARSPLRVVYLGRWDPVKGIDIAVRAIRSIDANLSMTIHAVAACDADRAYEAKVRALALGDPRIVFAGPLPREDVPAVLAQFDVLAVPSLWLETGPLAVLEAQAAGLFVLGSELGGIAELVRQSGAGELVEAGNVEAWACAFERLAQRWTRDPISRDPLQVRSMPAVAAGMAEIYQSLSKA